jgi:signal transduction histidine kinase
MAGFASLVKMHWLPPKEENEDWPGRITEAATKMDKLISDLLEYGCLGYMHVPLTLLGLDQEVAAVLHDLEFQIQRSNASIKVDSPLPVVSANSRALHHVLFNLVSNALKFVPTGTSPEVRIRAEHSESEVKLWIEDNGIGIAPHHTERIFEAFERLEDGNYEGHGIGLAIAQKAVSLMGRPHRCLFRSR